MMAVSPRDQQIARLVSLRIEILNLPQKVVFMLQEALHVARQKKLQLIQRLRPYEEYGRV